MRPESPGVKGKARTSRGFRTAPWRIKQLSNVKGEVWSCGREPSQRSIAVMLIRCALSRAMPRTLVLCHLYLSRRATFSKEMDNSMEICRNSARLGLLDVVSP